TLAAMREGADVIVQATLLDGRWLGRADVLRRVPLPSRLGDWSYEVWDTKLARETKAGSVLQICLYSDLLETIQGARPEHMYIVPPRDDFKPDVYRVDDFLAYYRLVRRRLEEAMRAAPSSDGALPTYPEPVPHCDICNWWPVCDGQRRGDASTCSAGSSRTPAEARTMNVSGRSIPPRSGRPSRPLSISSWSAGHGIRISTSITSRPTSRRR